MPRCPFSWICRIHILQFQRDRGGKQLLELDMFYENDNCISFYMLSIFLIACQNGTYGQSCKDTCGYCLNYDDCFHVNGTCVMGCEPGYKGIVCKNGQWLFSKNIDIISLTWGTFLLIYEDHQFFCANVWIMQGFRDCLFITCRPESWYMLHV